MTDEGIPEDVTWDCGCFFHFLIQDGERCMRLSPCRPDCETAGWAIAKMIELGKPVGYEVGP